MSRDTTDSDTEASDTEAENTGKKKKIQSTYLDFLPLMQPERNPLEGLRLIVRVKSQRREMMNMQPSKCVVQSQNMASLSGISQKIWLSTQRIISINLSLKNIYRKAF